MEKISLGLYNFKNDDLLKTNLMKTESAKSATMERFIKAYMQSFNDRIIKNELTLKK